jgi:hypothetical protein
MSIRHDLTGVSWPPDVKSPLMMKAEWIDKIEQFLEGNDFGKNWDGAYQDAVPTIRRFLHQEGFLTHIMSEWDSPSRYTELVATKQSIVVRIPWAEDYYGRSIVDLSGIEVHTPFQQTAE